jgi:hypothetical protein
MFARWTLFVYVRPTSIPRPSLLFPGLRFKGASDTALTLGRRSLPALIVDNKRKIPFQIIDPPTCPSVCNDRAVFHLRSIESPRLQSGALAGPASAYNGCDFVFDRRARVTSRYNSRGQRSRSTPSIVTFPGRETHVVDFGLRFKVNMTRERPINPAKHHGESRDARQPLL